MKNTPLKKSFTVKENTVMAENLNDATSLILVNYLKDVIYNELVDGRLIRTAALVKLKLRHEQVNFVDLKNAGKLDGNQRKDLLIRIIELNEEYENLFPRTYASHLLKAEMINPEWRFVFRTIEDRNLSKTVIDFLRIYNKWTIASAEYLLLNALCDIECGNDYAHRQENEEKTHNQIALADEYTNRIGKQEELLQSYLYDLHNIAEKLDKEYGMFDILESFYEEYEFIDTPSSV